MAEKNSIIFRPNSEIAIPWYMNYINIDYTVRDKNSNKKKNFKEYDINILGITDQSCWYKSPSQRDDIPIFDGYGDDASWQTPAVRNNSHVNELYIVRNKTIEKKKYSFLLKYYKECYPTNIIYKMDDISDLHIHRYVYSEPILLKHRDSEVSGEDINIIYNQLTNNIYDIVRYNNLTNGVDDISNILKIYEPIDFNDLTKINSLRFINKNGNSDNGLTEASIYNNIFIRPLKNKSSVNGWDKYYSYLSARYDNFIVHNEILEPILNLNERIDLIYGNKYKSIAIGGNRFSFKQDKNNLVDNAPIELSRTTNYNFIPEIKVSISGDETIITNMFKPYGDENKIVGGIDSSYSYYIKDDKIVFNLNDDFTFTNSTDRFTRKIYSLYETPEGVTPEEIFSKEILTYFTLTVNPKLLVSYLTFKYENSTYNINIGTNPLTYELLYSPKPVVDDPNNISLFYTDKKWIKQIENTMDITYDNITSDRKPLRNPDGSIIYYKNYYIESDLEYDTYYYTSTLFTESENQNWLEYNNVISFDLSDEIVGTYFVNDKGKKSKYSYAYIINCIENANKISYVNDINNYIFIPPEEDNFNGTILFTNEGFNNTDLTSNHYRTTMDRYDSYKVNEDYNVFTLQEESINGTINIGTTNINYKNVSLTPNLLDNLYGGIYNLFPQGDNVFATYLCEKINNDSISVSLGDTFNFNMGVNSEVNPEIVKIKNYVNRYVNHTYIFTDIAENNSDTKRYKYLETITKTSKNLLDLKLQRKIILEKPTNNYVVLPRYDITANELLIQKVWTEYVEDIINVNKNGNKKHWYDYEYKPYVDLIDQNVLEYYYQNYKKGWDNTAHSYTDLYLTYSPADGVWSPFAKELGKTIEAEKMKNYYNSYVAPYEKYKFLTLENDPSHPGQYYYNIGIDSDTLDENGKPIMLQHGSGQTTSEYRLYYFNENANQEMYYTGDGIYSSLFDYINKYNKEEQYFNTYDFLMNQYAILGSTYSLIQKYIDVDSNKYVINNYQKIDYTNKNILDNYTNYKLQIIDTDLTKIPVRVIEQNAEDIYIKNDINDMYGNLQDSNNPYGFKMSKYATDADFINVGEKLKKIFSFYNDYNTLSFNNYTRYFTYSSTGQIQFDSTRYSGDNGLNTFISDINNGQNSLLFDYNVNNPINNINYYDLLKEKMNQNNNYIILEGESDYFKKIETYENVIVALNNLLDSFKTIYYDQIIYDAKVDISAVNITVNGTATVSGDTTGGNATTTIDPDTGGASTSVGGGTFSGGGSIEGTGSTEGTGVTIYFDDQGRNVYNISTQYTGQGSSSSKTINGLHKWQEILDYYYILYKNGYPSGTTFNDTLITKDDQVYSNAPFGTIDLGNGIRFDTTQASFDNYKSFINTYDESYLNYGDGYLQEHQSDLNGILTSIFDRHNVSMVDANNGARNLLYIFADKIYTIISNIYTKIDEYNSNVIQNNDILVKQIDKLLENLQRTKDKDEEMNISNRIFVNMIDKIVKTEELSDILSLFNIFDIINNYDDTQLRSRISAYLQRAYGYTMSQGDAQNFRDLIENKYKVDDFVVEVEYISQYVQKYLYDNRKNITLTFDKLYTLSINDICKAGGDDVGGDNLSERVSKIYYSLCNGYNIYWVKTSKNNDPLTCFENFSSSNDNIKVNGFNIRYFLYDGNYQIEENTNIYLENLDIKPFNGTLTLSIDDFKNKNLSLHLLVYYFDSFIYEIPLDNGYFINIEPMYAVAPKIYNTEKSKLTFDSISKSIIIPFDYSNIEDNINTKLYNFTLEVEFRSKNRGQEFIQSLNGTNPWAPINNKLEVKINIPDELLNTVDLYTINYRAKWQTGDGLKTLYSKKHTLVYFFNNDDGFEYEKVDLKLGDNKTINYTEDFQTYWCNLYAKQVSGGTTYYWVANQGKDHVYFDLIRTVYCGTNLVQPTINQFDEYNFYSGNRNYTLTYIDTFNPEGENYNKYVIS